jgi:hypothetical protein
LSQTLGGESGKKALPADHADGRRWGKEKLFIREFREFPRMKPAK